jgi:hypothetical protein
LSEAKGTTMTEQDTDLLLMAGSAAGLDVGVIHQRPHRRCAEGWTPWDQLTDDGDAHRLAAELRLSICHHHKDDSPAVSALAPMEWHGEYSECHEAHGADVSAATRRAITRCAAAVATRMTPNDQHNRTPRSGGPG